MNLYHELEELLSLFHHVLLLLVN